MTMASNLLIILKSSKSPCISFASVIIFRRDASSLDGSTTVLLMLSGNHRAMAPCPADGSRADSPSRIPAHSTILRPTGSGVAK